MEKLFEFISKIVHMDFFITIASAVVTVLLTHFHLKRKDNSSLNQKRQEYQLHKIFYPLKVTLKRTDLTIDEKIDEISKVFEANYLYMNYRFIDDLERVEDIRRNNFEDSLKKKAYNTLERRIDRRYGKLASQLKYNTYGYGIFDVASEGERAYSAFLIASAFFLFGMIVYVFGLKIENNMLNDVLSDFSLAFMIVSIGFAGLCVFSIIMASINWLKYMCGKRRHKRLSEGKERNRFVFLWKFILNKIKSKRAKNKGVRTTE